MPRNTNIVFVVVPLTFPVSVRPMGSGAADAGTASSVPASTRARAENPVAVKRVKRSIVFLLERVRIRVLRAPAAKGQAKPRARRPKRRRSTPQRVGRLARDWRRIGA